MCNPKGYVVPKTGIEGKTSKRPFPTFWSNFLSHSVVFRLRSKGNSPQQDKEGKEKLLMCLKNSLLHQNFKKCIGFRYILTQGGFFLPLVVLLASYLEVKLYSQSFASKP